MRGIKTFQADPGAGGFAITRRWLHSAGSFENQAEKKESDEEKLLKKREQFLHRLVDHKYFPCVSYFLQLKENKEWYQN